MHVKKCFSYYIWRFFKEALCYITPLNHAKMLHFCLPWPIHLPGWSSLLLPHHHIEPDWVILLLNASVFHQGSHKARSNQPTERFTEKNAIKSRDLTHSGLDYQSINIPKVKWSKSLHSWKHRQLECTKWSKVTVLLDLWCLHSQHFPMLKNRLSCLLHKG